MYESDANKASPSLALTICWPLTLAYRDFVQLGAKVSPNLARRHSGIWDDDIKAIERVFLRLPSSKYPFGKKRVQWSPEVECRNQLPKCLARAYTSTTLPLPQNKKAHSEKRQRPL